MFAATLTVCPSFSSQVDVATDNLLDFEDSVNTVVETNGNAGEDQLDNHRPSETNNTPAWVRFSSSLAVTLCGSYGGSCNCSTFSLNLPQYPFSI